jgi:hypothetical protein
VEYTRAKPAACFRACLFALMLAVQNQTSTVKKMRKPSSANSGTGLVSINFRVPADVRRQLKMQAAANDLSMAELILKALRERGIIT